MTIHARYVPCRIATLPTRGIRPQERIAALRDKYWKTGAVSLGVYFMDGGSLRLKQRILEAMNLWNARGANVRFFEVANSATAQVRIAFTPGWGYYSYLGTDCLSVPANEQTMNLDSFNDQTSDEEVRRVVCHETGHCLAYPHEHQRREVVELLDPAKTIAYFASWQGWDAQTVQEQVLTPLADGDLIVLAGADTSSIMCYPLPASITYTGQAIPGGTRIDTMDYALAAALYPGAALPPPPPPSPPPPLSPPPPSPPSPPPAAGATGIGAFDPATGTWYLRKTASEGAPDVTPFAFGAPGSRPVVGDWNGDGHDKIGVVETIGGELVWKLADPSAPGGVRVVKYGAAGWVPVAGKW